MDIKASIEFVVSALLSIVSLLSLLLLFPLVILGIVLLVVSVSKEGKNKRRFRFWGIVSIVLPLVTLLGSIILYAFLKVILSM